jgi:SsrA-binding protein
MSAKNAGSVKIVARNRKARRDYFIEETFEAGLALLGTEVKSLRNGTCSLAEAYVRPRGKELYVVEMNIPPYPQGNIMNHEETRPRKLLMHRRELDSLIARCNRKGSTIIPLSLYFREGYAKVEIALVHRRKKWDKRDKKAVKQFRRDAQRDLGRHRK